MKGLGLFRRRKLKLSNETDRPQKAIVKPFSYPPKIILAWAKAIEGNTEILNFLNDNGYKELVMATHAIRLKDEARDWLMKNGYPHVFAMINAAEGNAEALKWLQLNKMDVFYNMALAIDHENEGFEWLKRHATQDIFLLTKSIQKVKDEIEERHNDVHIRG